MSPRMPRRVHLTALLISAMVFNALTGCAQPRPKPSEPELVRDKQTYNARVAAEYHACMERMVRRLNHKFDDHAAGRTTTPPTINILILSGGGENGAFGAGFLKGWGNVTDPVFVRPEFDVVTGVSTGALIAPFAFVGDTDAYERILRLYENPHNNWVVLRGLLFFLPGFPSLLNINGLEKELQHEVDADIVRRMAKASQDDRILAVGSTNLDYGEQRIWDLGTEAEKSAQSGNLSRVHQIMLASSAIPGAFPPRIIDNVLYVDGGVTCNILYNSDMDSPTSGLSLWRRKYPDRPLPRMRFWVIINEQVEPPPQIIRPRWIDVAGESVDVVIRFATQNALRQLATEAALMRSQSKGDVEVRYVSIPPDWRAPKGAPASGMFDKATMDSLAKRGMQMGADTTSWKVME